MAALTISTVRSWDPSALGTAATSLGEVVTTLDSQVKAVRSAMDTASARWTGLAADAADARVGTEVKTGQDLSAALDHARTALASGSTQITSTRSHLLSLVSNAEAQGFTVGDDGTVTSPTLPASGTVNGAEARDQQQRNLNEQATTMANSIAQALTAVGTADTTTATALSAVDVPSTIKGDVESLLERARTSGDVLSLLGGGAGAAALALALKKGWKLFGRTKVFASFLTKTFGQIKNYPGALRFLAGTGDAADAAAFVKFAQLGKDAEQALEIFKAGGPMSKLLTKIPGATGALRIAGKAFLPLTVVTGLADAVTGGGYDGGRGWATRGFGVAGAAGAGALLASSAGLVALGPVGAGIAGAAVLGYGAWTLGNYVYDHWGDITDFAGKAADWTGNALSTGWDATTGALSTATDWAGNQLSQAGNDVKDFAGDVADAGKSALHTVSFGLL